MSKKIRDLLAEQSRMADEASYLLDQLADSEDRHARATKHVGEAKREVAELRAREDARLTAEALARRNEARVAEEAKRIKRLKQISEGELHLEDAVDMGYRATSDGTQLVVAFPMTTIDRDAVRIWEKRDKPPGAYRSPAQGRGSTAWGNLFARLALNSGARAPW